MNRLYGAKGEGVEEEAVIFENAAKVKRLCFGDLPENNPQKASCPSFPSRLFPYDKR